MKQYASLHNHSEASILDGIIKPVDLLRRAAKKEIEAVALTEHGNLGSHLEAQLEGAKLEHCPKILFGMEAYFVDDISVKDKTQKRKHIILIAKDNEGYRNLIRLNNIAWRNFYYTPRLDFETIQQNSKGLICTSACCKGIVSAPIIYDQDYKKAKRVARDFKDVFGEDFYIEVQMINIDDEETGQIQQVSNKYLSKIAKKLNIPLVITNDTHYLKPEDYILHQKVLHISRDSSFVFTTHDLWLKDAAQLLKAKNKYHPDFPMAYFEEGIASTIDIANKCNVIIDIGKQHIPKFPLKTHPEYSGEKDKNEFFEKLVGSKYRKFVREKKIPKNDYRYQERIKKELDAIFKMDAVDYFLIVEDLIRNVRSKGKLVLIRGSANGSLICYLLEFGYIDPVKHNILFERFISPARAESGLFDVDIDIDMESEERPLAVDYLKERYGDNKVCNVGSYGRLMWKACIKDMARVEALEIKAKLENPGDIPMRELSELKRKADQFSFQRMNTITRFMEAGSKQEGGDLSIEESKEKYPQLKDWWEANEEWIDKFVKPIVGIRKSASIHPASVVVTPGDIDDWLPIRSQPNPKNKTERILCTQWETSHTGREDLRAYGTMALDILGVKTLSIIASTIRLIEQNHGVTISVESVPFDDKKTINGFKSGETMGVFQLSAPGITTIVKQIKPDCFEDVVNLTAIDRPGALANKAHHQYAARKHGEEEIESWHKSVEPVMADTYGIPIYSEHIMLISMAFSGFKPVDAEKLRQLMKQKDRKIFAKFEKKFVRGAVKLHGKDVEEKAKKLWEVILRFGAYSFPKAHAASYGLIAWLTMFLKTNYPAEFFANHLNYSDHDEYNEIKAVASKTYGIKFIMPEINKSGTNFTASGGKITWALAGIKGIGGKALEEVVEKQPYTSFEDFLVRTNARTINKARIQALIMANVFRKFGEPLSLLEALCQFRRKKLGGKKLAEEIVDPKYYEYQDEDWLKERADMLGIQSDGLEKIYSRRIEDALDELNLSKKVDKLNDFNRGNNYQDFLLFGQATNIRVYDTKVGRIMSGKINDGTHYINFVVWNDKYESIKGKEIVRDKSMILLGGKKRAKQDDHSLSIGVDGIVKVIAR